MILVGGGERVDVWTEATRLTLDDVAFENAERRDYTWFAYPGFRDGKTVRYGDLAAHGEVRVARAAIPKTQPPPGGCVFGIAARATRTSPCAARSP